MTSCRTRPEPSGHRVDGWLAQPPDGCRPMAEISSYLHDLAVGTARELGPDTQVSITFQHERAVVRAASSDERAARCDQVEANLGTGPCLEAMRELHAVLVARVDDGAEYPEWRRRVAEEGFVSAVAMPAHVAPGLSVALNLYSTLPDPWDARRLVEADRHVKRVAAEIQAHTSLTAEDAGTELQRALSARAMIEQAVGAVMECNGCTSQEALDVLLRSCEAGDVDLVEAARVVLSTLGAGAEVRAPAGSTPPRQS